MKEDDTLASRAVRLSSDRRGRAFDPSGAVEELLAWADHHEALLHSLHACGPTNGGISRPSAPDSEDRWLSVVGYSARIVWLYQTYAKRVGELSPDCAPEALSTVARVLACASDAEPTKTRYFAQFAADIVAVHARGYALGRGKG